MKFPLLLAILLLSASPAVAQYNNERNCIRNKGSVMQRYESLYLTTYQQALSPGFLVELARQLERAGQFSEGLSQSEKNGMTYKFMMEQLAQMKRQLEVYENLPDCAGLQGGKGQ